MGHPLSSLIFGAVHGNPVQIPFAFVLGTALGWMYYRTGSLLPSILMHFVNNGTAVCTFLFAEDPQATLISTYGTGGAAGIAVLGVVLTVVSIGYIVRQIPQTPCGKSRLPCRKPTSQQPYHPNLLIPANYETLEQLRTPDGLSLPDHQFYFHAYHNGNHLFSDFFPLIESHGWRTTASIIWLYLGTFVFYKVTRKYTKWWKRLENKKEE